MTEKRFPFQTPNSSTLTPCSCTWSLFLTSSTRQPKEQCGKRLTKAKDPSPAYREVAQRKAGQDTKGAGHALLTCPQTWWLGRPFAQSAFLFAPCLHHSCLAVQFHTMPPSSFFPTSCCCKGSTRRLDQQSTNSSLCPHRQTPPVTSHVLFILPFYSFLFTLVFLLVT